jgi:two-component system response regulator YesN
MNIKKGWKSRMTRLLIAEDQVWTRKGLIEMIDLNLLGIVSVDEAENGIEALDKVMHGDIDLVLSDIRMPGIDGLELARIVTERFPQVKVIIISGHDEFQYAQQAIRYQVCDYLLKPVNAAELNYTLEKTIAELHTSREKVHKIYQNILSQLLNGLLLEDIDALGEFRQMYGLIEKRIVRVQGGSAEERDALVDDFRKVLTNSNIDAISVSVQEEICLLASSNFPLDNLQRELTDFFQWYSAPSIRIGIGNVYADLNQTWISDLESLLALHVLPKEQRICEYQESLSHRQSFEAANFAELWEHCTQKNHSAVNELLSRWFTNEISDRDVRLDCFMLVKSAFHLVSVSEQPIDTHFTMRRLQSMVRMSEQCSTHEMIQWVNETLRRAFDPVTTVSASTNEQIIDWCKSYIINNLDKNLSLASMAGHVHFSPSHLSNLFKQVTGQNYIDYITGLKISKAKKELEETNKKVHDIACALGFEDARYFGKLFRRELGMTPTEYKMKISKEKTTWTSSH